MENENMNLKVPFHQKMNRLFGEILKCDWEPDKGYPAMKGSQQMVRYVSISKIKRQLAPLIQKMGLSYDIDHIQTIHEGDNLSVRLKITFTDIETGYGESSTTTGGSKIGDKALQIASSYAIKTYLTNKFMIIDGIEPEDVENPVPKGPGFVKKTVDETNEVKSKIQENAIQQPPAETPKKETLVQVDEKKIEDAKGLDDPVLGYIPTSLEVSTMDKIMGKWKDKLNAGEIDEAKFKEVCDAKLAIITKNDTTTFIRKYRVM